MSEDSLDMPFHASENPGPPDSSHLMYRDYASNRHIYLLIVYAAVVGVGLFLAACQLVPAVFAKEGAATGNWEWKLLQLVGCGGALGGLLHMLTSLGRFVGARRLLRSWSLFYVLRPVVGAGLAVVVYFVLRTGILAPGSDVALSNLNVYGILAFATLTGLFARQAIEKLAQIFDVMFQKVKDDISSRQANELPGRQADLSARIREPKVPPAERFTVERVNDPDV